MTVNGIFKVIPSGVIDKKRLRATVMLSPAVGTEVLETLPSALVDEWRKKDWTLKVVRLRTAGEECPLSFDDAIRSADRIGNCKARWSAGAAAWGTSL